MLTVILLFIDISIHILFLQELSENNIKMFALVFHHLCPVSLSVFTARSAGHNRPFPNYFRPRPLFQSEPRCSFFHIQINFHSYENELNFHVNEN